MLDLLVRGGTVVDGTGAPPREADIAVKDGRIAEVGCLEGAQAAETLDAGGLVVTPGFIDVHSHSDFTLLVDPRAQSQIAQGVTTEVIGNCGHGCAPLTDPRLFTGNMYGYRPGLVDMDWTTTAGYLERLEAARPAVNVATLVPNGNLRLAVLERPEKRATPDEVGRMGRLLEEGLEAGAFGYSNGLEYSIERACTEEETVELCGVVSRAGGLYATHERDKDERAVEAIEEAVRVAEAAGVRLQISHIIPRRSSPPRSTERVIEVVERSHDRGMDVGFDAHTRLHGILTLSAVLPSWAFEGGAEGLAARLRDPDARARLKLHETNVSAKESIGWERVFLFASPGSPELVGKSFQELAPSGDVLEAMYDILLKEAEDPHRSMIISHSYEEEWLRQAFRSALCTVGSDATALATDGPLADAVFLGAYTWAAWFFRRFVRDDPDFTLEEAVQKLAAKPADRLGLTDRGRIRNGARADLAVFDPGSFRERGTLWDPNQPAEGVSHVVVNGGVTMKDGAFTGHRSGQVLRRS